jgi:hypothetical protein
MKSEIRRKLVKSGSLRNLVVGIKILRSGKTKVVDLVKSGIVIVQIMRANLVKPIKSEWETKLTQRDSLIGAPSCGHGSIVGGLEIDMYIRYPDAVQRSPSS